jgi:hypothetical protein
MGYGGFEKMPEFPPGSFVWPVMPFEQGESLGGCSRHGLG